MLQKLGIKEESIQLLENKRAEFIEKNKFKQIGMALLHMIILFVCWLSINLIVFNLSNGRTLGHLILSQIPNFWLLGPAGDMAQIGFDLMVACLVYTLLFALIPKPDTTYLQRFVYLIYRLIFIAYGVLIIFILYARSAPSAINMAGIQLVPFRDIWVLILRIYHHTINLPYAYALLFGNIILFTPLAFLLRPHFKTGLKCFLVMLAIFIILEGLQVITGRGIFDIDDLIKYSLGVPLGFGIRKVVEKIKLKKEEGSSCDLMQC